MSSGIPTAKTYLLFALKFYVIAFAAYLLCVTLFMAGRPILGWLVIFVCVYLYWRGVRALIRRSKQGIRRTDDSSTALREEP